jgi:hypothetical protein
LGSRQQLTKISSDYLVVGQSKTKFSTTSSILGVTIDQQLTFLHHINDVKRVSFYQLRQLRCIRRLLSTEAALTLVHAFVTSRVDYCNLVFSGCPEYSLNNLQSIRNAAARLYVYNKRKFDHIGPLLSELHWLSIRQRIDYKVAVITYKCLRGNNCA